MGVESKTTERADDEEGQVANHKEIDSDTKRTSSSNVSVGDTAAGAADGSGGLRTGVVEEGQKQEAKVGNHQKSSDSSQELESKQKAMSSTAGSERRVDTPNFNPVTSIMDMPSSSNRNRPQQQPDNIIPGAYAEMPATRNGFSNADHYSTRNQVPPDAAAASAAAASLTTMESGGLAVANRVEEVLPQNLPQAHDYEEVEHQQAARKQQQERKRFRTVILFLVIFVIAITMILVAVLYPLKNNNNEEVTEHNNNINNQEEENEQIQQGSSIEDQSPALPMASYPSTTNTPTILAETWQGLPDYTLAAIATDPDSPQALAYDWVLNDPNATLYPAWKILQRFALVVFYKSTGGEDWILQKDWLSYNVDECSWYYRNFLSGVEDFFIHEGVTEVKSELELIDSVCDSDGRYLYLIFTDNNMHGTLPPELSLLSDSLLDLEVGSNENLGGVIPSTIGLMTNLRKFYANRNQHTGQIPTEIGLLAKLEVIELGYNPFTGSLPSEMGNMEALSFLSVRQNDQMTGIMPTELYRLTNMVSLYIHGLDLVTSAQLLPEIGQLTKLENLKTYPLPFNTSIPTEIGLLTNMLRLNFWKSHITGSLPSELFLLTRLKRLDIDANALTGTLATEFGRFPNLTMAWMDGNRFSGTLPGSIFESWGKLTLLAINNNNLEGPLPTEVGLLTSIQQLRLSHNEFTGRIPSELGLLNNVTELFLHDTKINGNIPETMVEMAALEHLTVSNTSLTGSIPNGLCDRVWDMTYTCNEYYGGAYTICYDAERVNFTCSSTDLCGCDACGEC